jgi:hypothetical protein
MTAKQLDRSRAEPIDVGLLSCYERPLPAMAEYDLLLSAKDVETVRRRVHLTQLSKKDLKQIR